MVVSASRSLVTVLYLDRSLRSPRDDARRSRTDADDNESVGYHGHVTRDVTRARGYHNFEFARPLYPGLANRVDIERPLEISPRGV